MAFDKDAFITALDSMSVMELNDLVKAIEEIGFYDPMVRVKKDRVKLDLERVDYWIGVGAQPSVNV